MLTRIPKYIAYDISDEGERSTIPEVIDQSGKGILRVVGPVPDSPMFYGNPLIGAYQLADFPDWFIASDNSHFGVESRKVADMDNKGNITKAMLITMPPSCIKEITFEESCATTLNPDIPIESKTISIPPGYRNGGMVLYREFNGSPEFEKHISEYGPYEDFSPFTETYQLIPLISVLKICENLIDGSVERLFLMTEFLEGRTRHASFDMTQTSFSMVKFELWNLG